MKQVARVLFGLCIALLTPALIETAFEVAYPRPLYVFEECQRGANDPETYRRCSDAMGGWRGDIGRHFHYRRIRLVEVTVFGVLVAAAGTASMSLSPFGIALIAGGVLTILHVVVAGWFESSPPIGASYTPWTELALLAALGCVIAAVRRYVVIARGALDRASPDRTAAWLIPLTGAVALTVVLLQLALGTLNAIIVLSMPLTLTWLAIIITTTQAAVPALGTYAAWRFRRRRRDSLFVLGACLAAMLWPIPVFVYPAAASFRMAGRSLLVQAGQLPQTEWGRDLPLVISFGLVPMTLAILAVVPLLLVVAVALRRDCRSKFN